jgi:hypothetical protein
MKCDLKIILDKQIVVSSFSGPIKTENRYQNRDRTLSFCRENGIFKLIVDTCGQVSHSTTMEIFAFAAELAAHATGFHIAFVRDAEGEDIGFMDNVAANRGCQCKSFFSFEEAELWLMPGEN